MRPYRVVARRYEEKFVVAWQRRLTSPVHRRVFHATSTVTNDVSSTPAFVKTLQARMCERTVLALELHPLGDASSSPASRSSLASARPPRRRPRPWTSWTDSGRVYKRPRRDP